MTIRAVLLSFLALAAAAHAFSLRPTTSTTGALTTAPSVSSPPLTTGITTALYAASRRQFVLGGGTVATAFVISGATPFLALAGAEETTTLPNGVSYTVQKTGTGPEPSIGELAAIRFKATAGDNVIDDIFDTAEPYYTRVGSGGMLKGVEAVLPMMRVGDRWTLVIPGNMAFGPKGRPASAGKPRIPSDATIIFEVEMVGLPGKEPELIELIGD